MTSAVLQPTAMEETTYSFVYDRAEAERAFQGIGIQGLLLAVLAGIRTEPRWEGCIVYQGAAPGDSTGMVCIGMRGPGAIEVQERVVQAFEGSGIPVPAIYEGGPEPELELARVAGGLWAAP